MGLSFSFKLTPNGRAPSVNENREKRDPEGAIDQIGHVLLRLIHAFSESLYCANIFQAKWDIKDGFWRLYFKEGGELNLCYVLSHNPGMPINLVVPASLQMGWIESLPYFCTVSETGEMWQNNTINTPVG